MDNIDIKYTALTDIGKKRQNNEDAHIEFQSINGMVFVVCDGLGGHAAGEYASYLATQAIKKKLNEVYYENPYQALEQSICFANQTIFEISFETESHFQGMATTVVAALYRSSTFYIANVGDSRAYLFSQKKLQQLTKDHTFLQELIDQGMPIPKERSSLLSYRNSLRRCVGFHKTVVPQIRQEAIKLQKEDILLLCTDGLTDMLLDEEIEAILREKKDIETKANLLIHQANEKGGNDNITVTLIEKL
ncbi:MAG: Stp1/IreP family PP2C-type Ser/Thr phosphatase [Bacteroidia bacterium]|nr:Stp1/IreP family PP2C-type Ser/Thr phosphatase [Bacteroidia bacterium]MDW8157376.1 Stp1/IreP family PP2C-type Ser/Thr phosphatase [Bacteroidia bacterium]